MEFRHTSMHVSEQNLNFYTCYKLRNEQIHINVIMFYTEIMSCCNGYCRYKTGEVIVPETLNDSHAQRLKFVYHER
jgi:hypothetical protein